MGKELELAIKIGGRLDGSLASAVHSAQAQLNKISKTANRFMNLATLAVGAGTVKFVKDSIVQAMDYEKSMAGVAKVVDDCRDANGALTDTYYELSNGILELSTNIPMTANDIASIVESAGQANIAKDELLGFAESAAKMGIAFDTSAEQAGEWMAQWRTSMRLTQPQVETLADQINYLGNTSSEKAVKLAEVVSRVGSLGQIAGLSGGEIAALAAAMPGVEAEVAATGIKNMTKAMTKGEAVTARQQSVLNKLGFSATNLANRMQSDAQGAILDFLSAIKQLPEEEQSAALSQYFGNESIASIAPLISNLENLKEQFQKVGDASKYAGSMENEYEAMASTTANQVELLKNNFQRIQIEFGSRLLPVINKVATGLAEKAPEISEMLISALEKVIPAATRVLNYFVDNADRVVSAIIKIATAWAAIKIGSGLIKGVDTVMTLGSALIKISSKVGAAKVLQGLIGTFTGIGTAAGTAGGAVTGFIGTIVAAAGPLLAVAAALAVLGFAAKKAYDYYYDKKYNYAEGMNESAVAIGQATKSLIEYNNTAERVSRLREIIKNPESSAAQIENAKQELEEIASMLSEEYDLVINADTSSLENAVNMAQQLSREELVKSGTDYAKQAIEGAKNYKRDTVELPNYLRNQRELQDTAVAYSNIVAQSDLLTTSVRNGQISSTQYLKSMNDLYNQAKDLGYATDMINGSLDDSMEAEYFVKNIPGELSSVNKELENANKRVNEATANIKEYEESSKKAGDYLTQALASDVSVDNKYGIDSNVEMLESLGRAMSEAGMDTNNLAAQFAMARSGYTDFSAAISDGKAGEMAQNFIDFQTAIGQSADVAVSGAALIANGFQDATSAASAGEGAIRSVLNDMVTFGNQKGIFDGMDAGGVADKLSDMAHAMDLMPENKSITIDANGNFQVIQEAENQIASLKSIGNVDVAVNANGDLQIIDDVTGKVQELQDLGAVDLQVNANGNIDVLNDAGFAIAQIDSQTGRIITLDATVTAGNIDTAPFQTSVNSVANAATQNGNNQNVIMNATLNAGNINTAPFAAGVRSHAQSILGGFEVNQSANITINAQGNAQSQAQATTTAVKEIPQTHNTSITANGNALATARGVQTALRNLPSTKNITINIKTNGSVPKFAALGEHNSPGGLYMVNDQNISDPREVIEYSGRRFWYEGRNVLTMLPRGANVYTAAQSRPYIDGSHRNGLDSVPFDGYVAELHRNERVLTADEAQKYRKGNFADGMRKMNLVLSDDNRDGGSRGGNGSGSYNITYAPSITVTGNADTATIVEADRISQRDFAKLLREHERDRRRRSFE